MCIRDSCGDVPCEYFYYLQEDKSLLADEVRSRSVLIVSGLRGDDYLSPTVLLNLYGKVRGAARVIYFPLANPSGFSNQKL